MVELLIVLESETKLISFYMLTVPHTAQEAVTVVPRHIMASLHMFSADSVGLLSCHGSTMSGKV